MKIVISEQQLKRIITEQSDDSSAASCDKNIAKDAGYLNNWRSMDENKLKEIFKSIKSTVNQAFSKSKEEYIKWFQNPATIQKFKTPEEKAALKKLPLYLQSINTLKFSYEGPPSAPTARAWVNRKQMDTINYNLSQIHDGNDFQGQSINNTTKHEMGHLIDYFFENNGVKTYIETTNADIGTGYTYNYIINDREQYTRLNVLRGIVDAEPNDHPLTLLNKFLAQVKSGKITSNNFNFSAISSNTPGLLQKNNRQQAFEVYKLLQENIFVDGKSNYNIQQLFSNFGINKNGTVYVSFDLLAQFNLTAKDSEKKYYFLKMSPK